MNEGGNHGAAGADDEVIAGQNEGANLSKEGAAALKNRIKSSSQCVVIIAVLVLTGIFVQIDSMKQANSKLLLICTLSAATAGADGLLLRFFIAEFLPENPGGCQYKCIKLLAHNCSVLLMITSYLLLLLADTSHAVMVVALLVMCALVVVLLCKGVRVDHGTDAAAFARRKDDLERLLDFAVDVAYILYGGLIGRVFGYFKSSTEQPTLHNSNNNNSSSSSSSSNNLQFPELLIFFGSLFAALGLVVSSTPPVLSTDRRNANRHEDRVVRGLEYYNSACAAVAMAATLALAYVLVGEFMILALVPEMAAAVAWVVVDLDRQGRALDADAAAHRPVSLAMTALAFGGAMAMFLKIGGSPASGYQGTLFLLIAAAVVSGLGWRMLVHRPPIATAAVYVLEFSHWMSLLTALPLLAGLVVAEIL